jgi:hypothetical protein
MNHTTSGLYNKNITIVNDASRVMPQFGASLAVVTYAPWVINYSPEAVFLVMCDPTMNELWAT